APPARGGARRMSGSWRCLSDGPSSGGRGAGGNDFLKKRTAQKQPPAPQRAGRAYTPLIIRAGVSKSRKTRRACPGRHTRWAHATIFNTSSVFVSHLVGGSGFRAVIKCVKIFCKGGKR